MRRHLEHTPRQVQFNIQLFIEIMINQWFRSQHRNLCHNSQRSPRWVVCSFSTVSHPCGSCVCHVCVCVYVWVCFGYWAKPKTVSFFLFASAQSSVCERKEKTKMTKEGKKLFEMRITIHSQYNDMSHWRDRHYHHGAHSVGPMRNILYRQCCTRKLAMTTTRTATNISVECVMAFSKHWIEVSDEINDKKIKKIIHDDIGVSSFIALMIVVIISAIIATIIFRS